MSAPTLAERLADHTQQLIVGAAVDLLEETSIGALTVRAAAARANVSERTVFRYFATRDAFLDAVAAEVARRMELPPHPRTVSELLPYAGALYRRFEAGAALVKAALHSDLFPRMRDTQARQRWLDVRRLVDAHAPKRAAAERRIAAANVRYYLSATTWHYYRFYFGFSLDETIACAQTAIRQAVEALGRKIG